MTSKFTELAIDCADPGGLARFWCSVLDYDVQDEDDETVTIGSPFLQEGERLLGPVPPILTFARVPERARASRTGSTSTSTRPTGSKTKRSAACSTSALDTPPSAKATRAGSCSPTRRATSSVSWWTAAPDRKPPISASPLAHAVGRVRAPWSLGSSMYPRQAGK